MGSRNFLICMPKALGPFRDTYMYQANQESHVTSNRASILLSDIIIFRHTNREPTMGNITTTFLNILEDKCIYEAEVLYYCDDRALQSHCLKTLIIVRYTVLSDTALQSYTKGGKILQPLLSVMAIHVLSKEP